MSWSRSITPRVRHAHSVCRPRVIYTDPRGQYWCPHVPPFSDGPMRISPSVRPAPSPNLWLTRGRHEGTDAPEVVRTTLQRLKERTVLDDQHELPGPDGEDGPERIFEARWKAAGTATVRARLTLARPSEGGQDWVLAAEAERPWNEEWPSPATMFWPD